MADWYVSTTKWLAITPWSAGSTQVVGNIRRPTVTPTNPSGNGRAYRCSAITTGVTAGTEPTWPTTNAGTVVDGGVTWTEVTCSSTYGWSAAAYILDHACTTGKLANGDTIYVGHDHSENYSTANIDYVNNRGSSTSPIRVICVRSDGSVPPVAADVTTGGRLTTTGNNNTRLGNNSFIYAQGFELSAGFGSGANNDVGMNCWMGVYENSIFRCLATGVGANILICQYPGHVIWRNCQVEFGAGIAGIKMNNADRSNFEWFDTPNAILGTYNIPYLFNNSGWNANSILVSGVDLSAIGAGKTVINIFGSASDTLRAVFTNCKLGSGVTLAATVDGMSKSRLDVSQCSSGSSDAQFMSARYSDAGSMVTQTAYVRTNGAKVGGTAFGWNITTRPTMFYYTPFEAPPFYNWNSLTGLNQTATVYGMINAAAMPTNADIMFKMNYLGDASSGLWSCVSAAAPNVLSAGTALSADASAWDSGQSARENSTTYAVGQSFKVASNPGRVFFCTSITTGTSAATEPAGYATAVDGDSITDGGATFRAAFRFAIAVTASSPQPQIAGPVAGVVKVAKASATVYIDPMVWLG